ncbi:hypothetical protein BJX99DRAFT_148659 [Aspergillus californicus]
MLPSIDYQSLVDFQGLPVIRETLVNRTEGFIVANIPSLTPHPFQKLELGVAGSSLIKRDPVNVSSIPVLPLLEALHKLSHKVFKNLSHALELPWERYLGEMHEFIVSGQDGLQVITANKPVPNAWSTLTIVINDTSPDTAIILYGSALSVFSEGHTATLKPSTLDESLPKGAGARLVYYVRPNNDVFYTRAAGALMAPLSGEEYKSRKRVREMLPVLLALE